MTVILPVILIALVVIMQTVRPKDTVDTGILYNIFLFIENSTITMLISPIFVVYTMGISR
ncbi:GntT/GntP/DsdX family permease [Sodalis-like endosymbiont of Proechinophthirus fluctus]|uniref:GntT/GntP/DsdX family permease n=1 Tax=Sodalis-like endosymbiont of Proechinophthirus fluctus TaxID=1462730 RepID=UPI0008319850|nr:hypothetical protein [Sodalis-like endosymbiont of Proechinophthirus fluctus]